VYMTAMTTCFPGRRAGDDGDRRPSAREVALCTPWLDELLEILQPRLILAIGSLAASRFVPGRRLDDIIGRVFAPNGEPAEPDMHGVTILPLPHPSGQSRWLNDSGRRAKLEEALALLRRLRVQAYSR